MQIVFFVSYTSSKIPLLCQMFWQFATIPEVFATAADGLCSELSEFGNDDPSAAMQILLLGL